METPINRAISKKEIAEHYKISSSTLRKWIKELPYNLQKLVPKRQDLISPKNANQLIKHWD